MQRESGPQFSGERADWSTFKIRFRAYCRSKAQLDISETGVTKIGKDNKVVLADMLVLAVSAREVKNLAQYGEDGPGMWQALCHRYEHLTIADKQELEEQLDAERLTNGGDVEEYIANHITSTLVDTMRHAHEHIFLQWRI